MQNAKTPAGQPALWFFDMDHTLIDNDCDVSWKKFLVRHGLAPASAMDEADRFFADYLAGHLDYDAFIRFQLAEFASRTPAEMAALARWHFVEVVRPLLYPAACRAVAAALAHHAPVALPTATNEVIAAPLAADLGIPHLLATRLERRDTLFTGAMDGEYCGGTGKLAPAREFAARFGLTLDQAAYYGDSISDVPLLAAVGFPTVVNPGDQLAAEAAARAWPVVRWGLS
jgi:HAD superfamily hydrolase (TIGR01490 family)